MCSIAHVFNPTLPVLGPVDMPLRPLTSKVVDMIKKHLPVLRVPEFELHRGADHLHAWVEGRLPVEPLSDISAWLGL